MTTVIGLPSVQREVMAMRMMVHTSRRSGIRAVLLRLAAITILVFTTVVLMVSIDGSVEGGGPTGGSPGPGVPLLLGPVLPPNPLP